jgi:hybrid cluster-associated redox disulfide protein
MRTKIDRNMTFHQILQLDARVASVLGQFNLGCVGCMGAMNETLEQGAMAHGIDVEDILAELNKLFVD